MQKKWNIKPVMPTDFRQSLSGYNEVILQLLHNRKLLTKETINHFLAADFSFNNSPFLFKRMEEVIARIIWHVKAGNKITIYGDYDADGVTASALLEDVLRIFKAKVDVYIPNRFSEGYGLNNEALAEVIKNGTKLMITVDTGIRNKDIIETAQNLGLEIIISDHHLLPETKAELPSCLIINPSDQDDDYPCRFLAGVGVAFKIAQALIEKSKLSSELKKRLVERQLDLVAVGTIADCVPLLDENRVLVKKGLDILNQGKRLGFKELVNVSRINVDKELDSFNVGFQIAPRLNAASRVGAVSSALELLLSRDRTEAKELALSLNQKNTERQLITDNVVAEVESQIGSFGQQNIIIGVSSQENSWNEGVIGLVAGKISEKYYRPVLIITKLKNGYKGSGRSIREFDLMEAINRSSEHLEKYGGHKMACGFSLKEENLEPFVAAITKYADKALSGKELLPQIDIDVVLDLDQISLSLYKEIEAFQPFGQDNPKPVFLSQKIKVHDIMTMGDKNQHIKLRLTGVWAISFNQAEKYNQIKIGDEIDLVYHLEMNDFNGRREPQLKIIDFKLSNI